MKISLSQAKKVSKGGSAEASVSEAPPAVDKPVKKNSVGSIPGELKGAINGNGAVANAEHMMDNDGVPDPEGNYANLARALATRYPWDQVADKIDELWDAKRPVAHRGIVLEWVPDVRIQSKMVELVLAYREGRPVERSEIITREVSSLEDILLRARENPAYLKALQRMIEWAGGTLTLPAP